MWHTCIFIFSVPSEGPTHTTSSPHLFVAKFPSSLCQTIPWGVAQTPVHWEGSAGALQRMAAQCSTRAWLRTQTGWERSPGSSAGAEDQLLPHTSRRASRSAWCASRKHLAEHWPSIKMDVFHFCFPNLTETALVGNTDSWREFGETQFGLANWQAESHHIR